MGIVITCLIAYNAYSQIPFPVGATGTYSKISTQEKVVALTFDDGPAKIYTQQILDILKKQQVKATFFVIGEEVKGNPDLLRRMVSEGHEIGNHGFSHDYGQRKLLEELNQTEQAVYSVSGTHTYFYRPPGGYIPKNKLTLVKNKGYVVTLWSVDSRDWRRPGVDGIVGNVLKNVFPGAIILFHDGGGLRNQTVEALEQLIDELRARGYTFVTLSELRTFETERS